jgi:hypothetical protein
MSSIGRSGESLLEADSVQSQFQNTILEGLRIFMSEYLYQRGGARIGHSYWGAMNATWPFATLKATEEAITLFLKWDGWGITMLGV